MTAATKETQAKKHECKFYLSMQSKEKISLLALDLKINQSALVDKLIGDFDETKQIISNISYMKSREAIFEQMANEVFSLKEAQKKYLEDVQYIKDELACTKELIRSFENYQDDVRYIQDEFINTKELIVSLGKHLNKKFKENKPVGFIGWFKKFKKKES
ncbi:MAG: hypothetical protein PHI29_04055 [Gallionella sp.]|nr:hypothetical protein [Gallionella sp.]